LKEKRVETEPDRVHEEKMFSYFGRVEKYYFLSGGGGEGGKNMVFGQTYAPL
jgi:hypothetical protein